MIAVAHADDETLGCFSILTAKGHDVFILHATDSSPLNLKYALQSGFATRALYAKARIEEMHDVLRMAGIERHRWRQLPIPDQGAPRNTAIIREEVLSYRAERIYTHAYEGGHPDHDAVAFALRGLPDVWEFPLYNAWGGDFVPYRFIEGQAAEEIQLTPPQVDRKSEMLRCFRSQERVIASFPVGKELFRPMAAYDFSKPPHEGELYYERRKLGWIWKDWHEAVNTDNA